MEAEKIFCKTSNKFCKDNNIDTNKFYNNMENLIKYYNLDLVNLKTGIRKNNKTRSKGSVKNRDYSIRKLTEPILATMINSITENSIKNKNSNIENFSLANFINYTNTTLNEISNLPDDIYVKIIDSISYEYNYELSQFIEIFFDKINELLSLVILPNAMFSKISCHVLSNLNSIIGEIKTIIALESSLFSSEEFEISKPYKNLSEYPNLDILIKKEFKENLSINEKIYNNFIDDKKINPKIYNSKPNKPVIKNEPFYNLDENATRSDLFKLLKKDDLIQILTDSLKPQIHTMEHIDTLIYKDDPKIYTLNDFISIYKKIAYDKFKTTLTNNYESYTNEAIYSEYIKVSEELLKKIDLSKKAISNKLYLASVLYKKNFEEAREILSILHKYTLDSNIKYEDLKNYKLSSKQNKILESLFCDKNIIQIKNTCDIENNSKDIFKIDVFLLIYSNTEIIEKIANSLDISNMGINVDIKFNLLQEARINLSRFYPQINNKNFYKNTFKNKTKKNRKHINYPLSFLLYDIDDLKLNYLNELLKSQ